MFYDKRNEIDFLKLVRKADYKRNPSEERETARLTIALLALNEQNPFVEISPDYDGANPASPLLCRIIPTMASYKVLQQAMHGEEHVVLPHYTAGKFYPSLIRWLDEKPEKYGLKKHQQARPVELTHPDLTKNQYPHTVFAHSFELISHDLLHCWRSGALTQKN